MLSPFNLMAGSKLGWLSLESITDQTIVLYGSNLLESWAHNVPIFTVPASSLLHRLQLPPSLTITAAPPAGAAGGSSSSGGSSSGSRPSSKDGIVSGQLHATSPYSLTMSRSDNSTDQDILTVTNVTKRWGHWRKNLHFFVFTLESAIVFMSWWNNK